MKKNRKEDKPLYSEEEDLLDYKQYVDQVFAYIKYFLDKKDSAIIGIAGNWGDGKTTVINFLRNRLCTLYNKEILFNKLYFFEVLKREFKYLFFCSIFASLIVLTILALFENYIKEYYFIILGWLLFFSAFFVVQKFPNFCQIIKQVIKSLFLKTDYIILDFYPWFSKDENQVIEDFFRLLSDKIVISEGTNVFEQYLNAILKYKNIDIDIFSKDDSLNTLYENIKKSLKNSNKKIVVFIDDMDRMTGKEIFCLLKLLKVVANFPNIVYILAYNKDYVAKELSQIITYNPEEYLEKIITNEYCMPKIKTDTIKNYFIKDLDEVVYKYKHEDNYNRDDIIQFLSILIPSYISNMRKVHRIWNAFIFHFELFSKAGTMLNIADLLYLTTLKIFNLNLYNRIWDEKNNIFSYGKYFSEEEKKKYEEKYIIGYIERDSLSTVDTDIINKLFHDRNSTYDLKRLSHQNHFELYFSYNLVPSRLYEIKEWLINYPASSSLKIELECNSMEISDIQDLIYSQLFSKNRDTNFSIGLIELMIRYPDLARDLYVNTPNTTFYFSERYNYINNIDLTKVAKFIDENKERCEINFLTWLLFDCLFYDGSDVYKKRELSDELNKIKFSILNTLKIKLESCKITDIYSLIILEILRATYNFSDVIKDKMIKFLEENDFEIVQMLQHFSDIGMSTNGSFYSLKIISIVNKLGLNSEYKQRLLKIKENKDIMNNQQFINYYSHPDKLGDVNEKSHIVDKSLEIIEEYISLAKNV